MAYRKPVLIERTSKKYKLIFLLGAFVAFPLALFVYLIGVGSESTLLKVLSGLMLVGGIALSMIAKFLAWWNHS